jgi:F0F1-type ATP synthase assembly protein I
VSVTISSSGIEIEAWLLLTLNLVGGVLLGVGIGLLINERRRR